MKQRYGNPTAKAMAAMAAAFLLPYVLLVLAQLFPGVPLPDKDITQTFLESILYLLGVAGATYFKSPAKRDEIVPDQKAK